MSKGVVFSTRPLNGREGHSIIEHMTVMENYVENIYLLSESKTDKTVKVIHSQTGMSVYNIGRPLYNWFEENKNRFDTWMDVFEDMDVSFLKDHSYLYIVGGLDLHRSNLTRFGKRVGYFPSDKGQIKFQSAANKILGVLALLKAHIHYNIPLMELAFDPNEMPCSLFNDKVKPNSNYRLFHGYDIIRYGIQRLDSLQYLINRKPRIEPLFKPEKKVDLTFGYTALKGSERDKYRDFISDVKELIPNHNIYMKDDNGQNTLLDRKTYLQKIMESKYTLILPSYDETCFSIYRLIESLNNDCVPLIHKDCRIDEVSRSFDFDLSVLNIEKGVPDDDYRIDVLQELKKVFLMYERGFDI